MTKRNLRRTTASILLAAAASLGPIALAAEPASAELPCAWDVLPGSTNPWNYPLDGVACVVLDTSNGIRLVGVTDLQPGWTYTIKASGGTSSGSRVEIRFENRSTKSTLNFRFEPGKTVIR